MFGAGSSLCFGLKNTLLCLLCFGSSRGRGISDEGNLLPMQSHSHLKMKAWKGHMSWKRIKNLLLVSKLDILGRTT